MNLSEITKRLGMLDAGDQGWSPAAKWSKVARDAERKRLLGFLRAAEIVGIRKDLAQQEQFLSRARRSLTVSDPVKARQARDGVAFLEKRVAALKVKLAEKTATE